MKLTVLTREVDYLKAYHETEERGLSLALRLGSPIYLSNVKDPPEVPPRYTGLRVLKSVAFNSKMSGGAKSNVITRGPAKYRGKPLFQLSLPERVTCPPTCRQWTTCYGNAMPFAHRFTPGPALEEALTIDLQVLSAVFPGGFVIRLHVLGDFYSVRYVEFWLSALKKHPGLAIYGYTHREFEDKIGRAITKGFSEYPDRWAIMRSDKTDEDDPLPGAYSILQGESPREDAVICPQQVGKTASCLTCGLCMNGFTPIQFLEQGVKKHQLIKEAKG